MTKIVHVVPVDDIINHDTNGIKCECLPHYKVPCPECDGDDNGCWNCNDGLIVVDEAIATSYGAGLIVVHNALDGRIDDDS